MAPNFSKNAILVGMVDYLCLACECHLKSEGDTEVHIAKPVHQKHLEIIQYVEEFKDDGIKKIKNKYFCELCNKLLTVLARVRLHISEQTHNDNKNSHSLKRVGNSIVAFGNIAISDQSWNGLHENSCAVCNLEYDNEEIHKNQYNHILNVIQIQTEFDKDKNIYHKIDEFSFHCLTCNMVHALNSLTSHFAENEHKKQYAACYIANNAINSQSEKILEDNKIIEDMSTKLKSTCNIQEINNDSKEKDHKDEIKPKVTCNLKEVNKENNEKKETSETNEKKISETRQQKTINTVSSKEGKVLKSHKSNEYIYDETAEDRINKVLGCKDYITQDENDKTWCILCDWIMAPSNIYAHINGKHHQTILKMHKENAEKIKNKFNKYNAPDAQKDNSKILDSLNEFQASDVNVNFESELATCSKCSKDIAFDHDAIRNHILEHKQKTLNKECKSKKLETGVNLASDKKQNLFTSPLYINRNVKQETKPEPLKNENNQKVKHENTKKDLVSLKLRKVRMSVFIEDMIAVENMMFKDIIINNKYCINILSLCFVHRLPMINKFRCQACHETFPCDQFDVHSSTTKHEIAINDSLVILNDNTEFIREIGNRFHCGFCNCVETTWAEMEVHLKSESHKQSKISAAWRLEQYRPTVANDQFERILHSKIATETIFKRFF